ncbi:Uncharacterized protein QTN25_001428 [Entamoeba marina]
MNKIFSSEEDEEIVEIAQENKLPPEEPTKKVIHRDVFWTGLCDEVKEPVEPNNNKKDDELLDEFLNDIDDENTHENKPPKQPQSLKQFQTVVKGFNVQRKNFALNEDMYDECFPTSGRNAFANVDDSTGHILRDNRFDIDEEYEVVDNSKRRHKKKGKKDKWASIKESMKSKFGDDVIDD